MKLYAVKTWGSLIPQLVLSMAKVPHEVQFLSEAQIKSDVSFGLMNPLRQVPTLILSDGTVMSESLAICTYIDENARLGLIPAAGSLHRVKYLRWSTFLVASIYPTFTFGDTPSRWVSDATAQDQIRVSTDKFREDMWRQIEGATSKDGPWFLGREQSLIDVYLAVMTFWRPRKEWFATNTPRISRVAERFREQEVFKKVYALNE